MQKITTMVVALLISLASIAGNGNSISSVISKELKVPAELKSHKLDETVNVQFKIAESGEATVINVETENPQLKKYVIHQFPKLKFDASSMDKGDVYFIDIHFKVL